MVKGRKVKGGKVRYSANIKRRCIIEAERYLETQGTVRSVAKEFGCSKSTLHNDIHIKLKDIDPDLYKEVQELSDMNTSVRHIRGGMATRERYKNRTKRKRNGGK